MHRLHSVDPACALVFTMPTRTEHRPGAAKPEPVGPGETLNAYARQVDELARMVEDWQASNRRYAGALAGALGELHVALDEIAADLSGHGGTGDAA